jgi:hypothetical protein
LDAVCGHYGVCGVVASQSLEVWKENLESVIFYQCEEVEPGSTQEFVWSVPPSQATAGPTSGRAQLGSCDIFDEQAGLRTSLCSFFLSIHFSHARLINRF